MRGTLRASSVRSRERDEEEEEEKEMREEKWTGMSAGLASDKAGREGREKRDIEFER